MDRRSLVGLSDSTTRSRETTAEVVAVDGVASVEAVAVVAEDLVVVVEADSVTVAAEALEAGYVHSSLCLYLL